MHKLHYSKGSCSLAIHVVLNEIGAKFELVNTKNSDGSKSAEFLKINPRGAVPVLEIDGFILRECVAILTYLLDNNANNLLPKEGLKRAKALEWLCFANATLHPAYSRLFFARAVLADKASENDLYAPSIKAVQNYWNEIERHLMNNQYLCGDDFTVADILVTVIANWSTNFKGSINFGEKSKSYFSRVIARPAFTKALTTEDVTYQVNK